MINHDLFIPEFLKEIITEKVKAKLISMSYLVEDNSLVGIPGDSVIVRKYVRADDSKKGGILGEGQVVQWATLAKKEEIYTVIKMAQGFKMTDEELLYGEDAYKANIEKLVDDMLHMIDDEFYSELAKGAQFTMDLDGGLTYANIVDLEGKFEDENDSEKFLFVNPKDYSSILRLNKEEFKHTSELAGAAIVRGQVGEIAGCVVVKSRKVPAGKVFLMKKGAVTKFNKKALTVESDRVIDTLENKTVAHEHFVTALTDASKVVVGTIKVTP